LSVSGDEGVVSSATSGEADRDAFSVGEEAAVLDAEA
jgi:hypothetical protein